MLGKRFRRTTSMSQLGAGAPAIGTAGEPVPHAVVQGAGNPHTVPYKAARPLILEQHISAGVGNANHARRSDVNSAVPVELLAGVVPSALQTQRSCAMEDGWCAVDVICEDMCIEGMGSRAKDDRGQLVPSSFGNSSYPGAVANGFGTIGAVAAGHGSTLPNQKGIWLHSGMHAGQGNGKRELTSPAGFLDVCFYCKRRLRLERDIFMYRGDTAFCSEECRHRQILIDERRAARTSSNKRGGGGGARARSETAVAA